MVDPLPDPYRSPAEPLFGPSQIGIPGVRPWWFHLRNRPTRNCSISVFLWSVPNSDLERGNFFCHLANFLSGYVYPRADADPPRGWIIGTTDTPWLVVKRPGDSPSVKVYGRPSPRPRSTEVAAGFPDLRAGPARQGPPMTRWTPRARGGQGGLIAWPGSSPSSLSPPDHAIPVRKGGQGGWRSKTQNPTWTCPPKAFLSVSEPVRSTEGAAFLWHGSKHPMVSS